jgi:hypothetical protein
MAGSWPVARVGLDNDSLGAVATDDGPRLNDRACGNTSDVGGDAVRRVAAIAWIAQPCTAARWRVRG